MMLMYAISLVLFLSVTQCNANGEWRRFCPSAARLYGSCTGVSEGNGPTLHHFASTMTWTSGKGFCQLRGKRLCYINELCRANGKGKELLIDVLPGDNWVPVLDEENEWVEVGFFAGWTCFVHSKDLDVKPAWGTVTEERYYKGYVYCCGDGADKQVLNSGLSFRYIGKTATYKSSKQYCENQNMRLCYSYEICRQGKPYFGVIGGDQWVAANDEDNEWVEIGDSGDRTCWIHSRREAEKHPSWGIREDGSTVEHVGFVYCCPI